MAGDQDTDAPEWLKIIAFFKEGPERMGARMDVLFHVNVCWHCDDPLAQILALRES